MGPNPVGRVFVACVMILICVMVVSYCVRLCARRWSGIVGSVWGFWVLSCVVVSGGFVMLM